MTEQMTEQMGENLEKEKQLNNHNKICIYETLHTDLEFECGFGEITRTDLYEEK